jgi:sugar phosphate isomerase/epimerase
VNGLARLSLNQATVRRWTVAEAVEGCVRAGIGGIGLWREPVADAGLARAAKLVRDAGLRVTSLCRGGFVTAAEPSERAAALADNRRAIDEAATLSTEVLVLVCGGLPAGYRDLDGARRRVAEAVAALAPDAAAQGVQLAIESLHPMFCSDRCVVSTLDQALGIAEAFPADRVGVVVDAYHVWWDPSVYAAIARAGQRIAVFQVADWTTPLPHGVLLGRAMIGDGCIELRRLREAVDRVGYRGAIEVEIFNQRIWDAPGDEVLAMVVARYREHVL